MKFSKLMIKTLFRHHNPVTLGKSKIKEKQARVKKLVKNISIKRLNRWAGVGLLYRLIGWGCPQSMVAGLAHHW